MLGERLKALRESNGKSQLEVCATLNIEQSTLANYESGRRTPKIEILIKLAEYYNCSVDYLLGIGEIKGSTPPHDYVIETNLENDPIIETYRFKHNHLLEKEMRNTLVEYFSKLSNSNQYIIMGEIMKLLKEQRKENQEIDDKPSDTERAFKEAIRTQKGNLDTKIG